MFRFRDSFFCKSTLPVTLLLATLLLGTPGALWAQSDGDSPLAAPESPLATAATQEAELRVLAEIERAPASVTSSGQRFSLTLIALILVGAVAVAALLVWRRE